MAPEDRPAKPSKRRRSRWARWVLRPLVWSPALVALLAVSVVLVLESDRFAAWAVRIAQDQAASYLGRDVEIGDLSIDLVPLSVEARDILVAGPEGSLGDEGHEPFAHVERLLIDARIGSLLRPGITLERMFVDKPVIRIGYDESGLHDAPRPERRRRRDRPRRLDVEVGTVEVVGGTLELEHRKYPLEILAKDFIANLGGVEGDRGRELAGQARAEEVTLVLPGARPYLGGVSVRGSYRPGGFEIAEGRFESDDLNARATGAVSWRENPGASFSIEATGDGRLLDRLGYGQQLFQGPFVFNGDFERSPEDWILAGDLSSTGATVVERRLGAIRGRLEVDADSARYRIESASYGNGSLRGLVRMVSGPSEAPVDLDLTVTNVDLERLLADQKIPISGLAARANGSFTYQFPRSEPRSGNGWADLKIAAALELEGLPVSGSAVLSFGDGRLQTEAVRLSGDGQSIVASGAYDMIRARGRFEIRSTTQAVDQILRLLPVDDPDALWRPASGRGEVVAELDLNGDAVVVNTEFNLLDVTAPGFQADRAQGRFTLDGAGLQDLRVELVRPSAALIVTGSVPLSEEPEALDSKLALALDAEGWPLADFAPWLPFELAVAGPFSGGALIEGSFESPRGAARGTVAEPSFGEEGGFRADRLDFDLGFSPEMLLVHDARLTFGKGVFRAYGGYDIQGDRLALEIGSEGLNLADLGLLPVAGDRLGGTATVSGTIGGSISQPELSARLGLEEVSIDGAVIGSNGTGQFSMTWTGRDLETEGGIDGLIRIAGGGVLETAFAALDFEVATPDVPAILQFLGPQPLPGFDASGRGRLTVRGALDSESGPEVRLRMDELRVRHVGETVVRDLKSLEPVALVFDRDAVVVESFYLGDAAGQGEIFVAGRIGLEAEKKLDLKVQSTLAASWFEPWVPDGVELVEGSFDVIGSVVGTLEAPRLDGVGQFTGGKIVTTGFAATFESTEAVFLFFPGQVVLDQLAARVAGGRISAAGTITLRQAAEPSYRFQVSGEGLNFRYPEGWSIRGRTDITLASTPGGRQLTGALDLDRALYVTDVPIELDQLLRSYFEQRRLEVEETDELLATTQLNLAVAAKETLRIRNNLANLRGSADLVIRGSLASPVVFGNVEFDPSGKLIYSGNEYELERGLLTFANPHRLEPVIDLVAHTALREYDVTLSLSGTPERLSFDFISDPPLAELEVIALMTGGRPQGPVFGETRRSSGLEQENVGAETFLYGQATSLVASRFNRLFGLDQFRIVPLTSATGDLSSARVTVGKRLSRDLFATYSYDPSETAEQIFELEWSISRSLILVITQNGDGTYAVDAKYQKAF